MVKKTFGNLGKTENMGGLGALITDTSHSAPEKSGKMPPSSKDYIIKTFTIDESDFAYIKQFVKYKRMKGETEFTQKEALGQAIALLKEKYPDV